MKKISKINYLISLVVVVSVASSCKKATTLDQADNNTTTTVTTANKIAPDGFNFNTTKQVSVNIKLLSIDNQPLKNVMVSLAPPSNLVNYSGADLFKAATDGNGNISASVTVPASLDTLVLKPAYTGIIQNSKALIINNSINVVLGGTAVCSGVLAQSTAGIPANSIQAGGRLSTYGADQTIYTYMGKFDSYGAPADYKVSPSDVISASFMTYLNASLPEGKDVRKLHPSYIAGGTASDLKVVQKADVWITFAYEGAGNLNSVGYYAYPTNTPPKTTADIKQVYYMFPNSSMPFSGGNLAQGTKIKLGTFDAGTSIGFVIFSAGWTGSGVNSNAAKFYSTSNLNPEPGDLARHTVLLNDAKENLFMIGFEDLNRTTASCDHDFNDVILYATSNPVTAISTDNVAPVDTPVDSDGDGVSDTFDAFPNDPTRAYISYYPSKDNWGTLAYEDQWPLKGDYDMNDLVVNYRYTLISNAQNNVVEMTGDYTLLAAGASYNNGFAVQFPFSASVVKQVTGQRLTSGYIKQAGNGVESGQKNAVIVPFDSYRSMVQTPSYFINTVPSNTKFASDTVHIYMQFTSPITTATLGSAPFNPFLISNGHRGFEVHLPGNAPTDLADMTVFGTQDDTSVPATGRYYLSQDNHPWAMSFYQGFAYPTETSPVWAAYLHFLDWAKSGGTQFTDWYSNTASDYRNSNFIYSK
ncbi:LruC domain-containing protein [Mucilaginibacter sp. PPCGB 2223]|uniref:LruC domain-containing protein n=1 Tax=Mucilaginibacter sp. PPCGB 2223 TaxID=1886027 RepID=UPI0020C75467|nr:LruC domain-containing protein [Mucilaginibacter sp. PPCGB 2223]